MTPLLVAGIASMLAGTVAKTVAAQRAAAQMQQREQAERLRQLQYQQEAQAEFAKSLAQTNVGLANESMGKETGKRVAAYERVAANPQVGSTAAPLAGEVQSVVAKKQQQGRQERAGQNQARLGSYGAWSLDQAVKNAHAANQLALVSNMARGSAGVLPYELRDAQQSQGGLNMAGTVLSSLGSLASLYGATAPAASKATVPGGYVFTDVPL